MSVLYQARLLKLLLGSIRVQKELLILFCQTHATCFKSRSSAHRHVAELVSITWLSAFGHVIIRESFVPTTYLAPGRWRHPRAAQRRHDFASALQTWAPVFIFSVWFKVGWKACSLLPLSVLLPQGKQLSKANRHQCLEPWLCTTGMYSLVTRQT